uniref:hypothetical protein n=1 Tax=Pseudomonas aeruginosa TaxID=287 RepID=UPI00356B6DB4
MEGRLAEGLKNVRGREAGRQAGTGECPGPVVSTAAGRHGDDHAFGLLGKPFVKPISEKLTAAGYMTGISHETNGKYLRCEVNTGCNRLHGEFPFSCD